jgi:hypothetical protein
MFPRRERLLTIPGVPIFFLLAGIASAQQAGPLTAANSLTDGRGAWELGAFLGGGSGAGKSSDTQFFYAGGRAGMVLTPDLFTSTPIRGNLEYAVEIMPVYTVFTPNGAVYGASIKPFLVQWNFTRPQRLIPYVHIAGGVLFTTSDVPLPTPSSINFTPQIGGGRALVPSS